MEADVASALRSFRRAIDSSISAASVGRRRDSGAVVELQAVQLPMSDL
jgi:hypothetical protein